jgi:hypothetical protein
MIFTYSLTLSFTITSHRLVVRWAMGGPTPNTKAMANIYIHLLKQLVIQEFKITKNSMPCSHLWVC